MRCGGQDRHEVARVMRVAFALVPGICRIGIHGSGEAHRYIRTQRIGEPEGRAPYPVADAAGLVRAVHKEVAGIDVRADHHVGRMTFLHPRLEIGQIVHGESAVARATVAHSGHQKQAEEIHGCPAAAHGALDGLVVIEDGARDLEPVVPALRDNELAAGGLEVPEVRIVVGVFGTEPEPLVVTIEIEVVDRPTASRCRPVEDVLEELRYFGARAGVGCPVHLRARKHAARRNRNSRRGMRAGVDVPCRRDLRRAQAFTAAPRPAGEHRRVELAAEGIPDDTVLHCIAHVAGF